MVAGSVGSGVILSLLIPAVGGQGGGVLSEWIVDAALLDGFPTHGTEVNAILLGALAGSGAMPISEDAFRKAIEAKGVAVKSNLAGFDLGLTLATGTPAA